MTSHSSFILIWVQHEMTPMPSIRAILLVVVPEALDQRVVILSLAMRRVCLALMVHLRSESGDDISCLRSNPVLYDSQYL